MNVGVDLQMLSRAMSCSVAKASLRHTVQCRGRPSEQPCWIAADACCVEIHLNIIDWAAKYGLHGMITRQTQKSYARSCSIGAEEHEYKLNRNSVQDY